MTRADEAKRQKREAALTTWAAGATDDQLRAAQATLIAPSYGLSAVDAQRVLNVERSRRATQKGVR